VPKLWNETIAAHRRDVRDAIIDATAALVDEVGPLAVTMSRVADRAGIGRATLYKYFPDVEAVLAAWHERHVAAHLDQLAELRDSPGDPGERLDAFLRRYAQICYRRAQHSGEVSTLLHREDHVTEAEQRLLGLFSDMIGEAARAGVIRNDVDGDELARYCLHALGAAGGVSSEAAVDRLVSVTFAGLRR
jgi:AcrR family transcriptional regulator